MAPHLIRPMRFVLPLEPGLRSAWLLRAGLFVYDHLGGRKILPATRTIDLARDPLGAPLRRRDLHGLRIFRLPGRRCPAGRAQCASMRPSAAPIIRTRTRCVARRARRRLAAGARCAAASSEVATARVLVNATGPWLGQFSATALREPLARAPAARQGQPHRGAPPVRARSRLHLPEPRRPRRVRAAVRARLHADRHHRPGVHRRSGGVAPSAGRDRLSVRGGERLFPRRRSRRRMWSGRSPACARSTTTARSKPQDTTRDYVLALDERTARRRCSPSMAARSRPIGGSPSRRSTGSRTIVKSGPAWTRRLAPAGRRFSARRRRGAGRRDASGLAVSRRRRMRSGWCAPTARASNRILGTARAAGRSRAELRRRPDGGRGALSDGAGMGADRRRRAVAAQQARPACHAGRARAAGQTFMAGARSLIAVVNQAIRCRIARILAQRIWPVSIQL